jgi:ABC-type sugar transport system substrate-binding protein
MPSFRRRATPSALALCLAAALVVAGCGSSSSSSSSGGGGGGATTSASASASGSSSASGGAAKSVPKETIGLVDALFSAPAQKRCDYAFTQAANKVGWTVKFADASGNPATALTDAQSMITSGVNALVMSSVPQAWVTQALESAKSKNIPTLAICGGIGEPDNLFQGVYTEDETRVGTAMAQPIIAAIKKSGKPAYIAMLDDTSIDAGIARSKAFKAAIKAVPNAHIVADTSVDLKNPVQSTQQAAADDLTAHPNLTDFFAIYDWMAPPAITALRNANNKTVGIYSVYADTANTPLLRDPSSPLKSVAEAPLAQTGLVAIDQLLGYFVNKTPISPTAFQAIAENPANYTNVANGASDLPAAPTAGENPLLGDYQISKLDSIIAPYLAKWKSKYGVG